MDSERGSLRDSLSLDFNHDGMVKLATPRNPYANALRLSSSSLHSNDDLSHRAQSPTFPDAPNTHWVADSPRSVKSFGTVHTPTTSDGESIILRPEVASIPSLVSSRGGSVPMPAHDSL